MKYAALAGATCFGTLGLIFQIPILGIIGLGLFMWYAFTDTGDMIKGRRK